MQVLEVEVALANGTLALVNAQSHPHLFRALQVHMPAMLLSLHICCPLVYCWLIADSDQARANPGSSV